MLFPSPGYLALGQSLLNGVPLHPTMLPLLLRSRIDRVSPIWKGLLPQRLCFTLEVFWFLFFTYSHRFTTVYLVLAIHIISLNLHNIL